MIIRFGLEFDSMRPEPDKTRLGFVVAGPSTFLSILEKQLGILCDTVSDGTRIVQYRSCLEGADSPDRFYHQSFVVDELGVARALLRWRDNWYVAGWEGTFAGAVGKRLQDMADVETHARENVALSYGERLANILKAMESRRTQIEKIELVDEPSDFPYLWQKIIEKFPTEAFGLDAEKPSGRPGSDLAALQQALKIGTSNGIEEISRVKFTGDGTVVMLRAGSRAISSRLIADYFKENPRQQSAVLTGSHGFTLDEALESVDLPQCGFQPLSIFRPPMQILPLALTLLWKPLDPWALSQFLNLPSSPLPKRVRAKLASVVVPYPGIGGTAWQKTLASLFDSERKDRGIDDKQVLELADAIDYWLMGDRFDPNTGSPVDTVAERCKRVADYLSKRVGTSRDDSETVLFASAQRQAADLAESVDRLGSHGKRHISRQQLERLFAFSAGSGSPLSNRFPEVGDVAVAENPAVFTQPLDEVIWWDFSMPELPLPHPWTRSELSDLTAQGLHLPVIDRELLRLSKTWLRPVRCVRERLILVIHATDKDHHPLWEKVQCASEGWVDLEIEAFLHDGRKLPGFEVKTSPVAVQPLPLLKRWWQLPDGAFLTPRDKESYSSFDALINSPYQWVCKHKLWLYTGGLKAPESGNRLKGSLVHRLFELFFHQHQNWQHVTEGQIVDWVKNLLPQLLEQEGATLLTPGMAAEREAFREVAMWALLVLVGHMKAAHIRDVRVEHHDCVPLFGGELEGYIDLLLTDKDGRETVVDVKWSGYRYRETELRQNRSFQLAVYSYMRKTSAALSYWPYRANFIIDGQRMLSQENRVFPNAVIVPSESGEGIGELWNRFESTYRWRRAQLDQGLVEVTVTGTEPTEASVPPGDGLVIDSFNDAFNDYAVLTGWRSQI